MGLLKDADRAQLQKELVGLQAPVKLVFFSQALDCEYCPLTKQVLEELVGLSDKIQLQEYNFSVDQDAVTRYKITRVPAGYEFGSLVGDIIDVSLGDSGLSAQSKAMLAQLKEPLHLQVFSTPT